MGLRTTPQSSTSTSFSSVGFRFAINAHQRHVRAKAPGFAPGIEEDRLLQARLQTGNRPAVGGSGNLAPGYFLIGHASHREAALGRHNICGRCFEQMRGDLPGCR